MRIVKGRRVRVAGRRRHEKREQRKEAEKESERKCEEERIGGGVGVLGAVALDGGGEHARDRARDDAAGGDDSDDDELLRSVDDETIEAYASRACGQLRRGGADPADRAPGASVSSLEAPAEVAERALTGAVLGLVASEPQLTAQQHFDREFAAARAAARKAVQEAAAREAAARAPVPVRARGARALTGNERRERLWKG